MHKKYTISFDADKIQSKANAGKTIGYYAKCLNNVLQDLHFPKKTSHAEKSEQKISRTALNDVKKNVDALLEIKYPKRITIEIFQEMQDNIVSSIVQLMKVYANLENDYTLDSYSKNEYNDPLSKVYNVHADGQTKMIEEASMHSPEPYHNPEDEDFDDYDDDDEDFDEDLDDPVDEDRDIDDDDFDDD